MRERGLKCLYIPYHTGLLRVAPVRERGLKSDFIIINDYYPVVAPVRERGLKSGFAVKFLSHIGRSREGAWIEILWPMFRLPFG